MKRTTSIMFALILLFLLAVSAEAAWQGPQEIITGTWGSGPGQFFFGSGDTMDSFPRDFGVDGQSRIFINDDSNARIQIFTNGGGLEKVIGAPEGVNATLGWPYNIYVHAGGSFVASYEGPQNFFFDSTGILIKKVDVYGAAIPVAQGYIFEVTKTKYDLYSVTGQLIKTYIERPLELGKVTEQPLSGGKYKISIAYPGMTYSILGGPFEKYLRESSGRLNAISGKLVKKYNQCGKVLGSLSIPQNQSTVVRPGGRGFDEVRELIAEYGEPVVAPNGDVYTWKRTPDKYSILKWTWVDDPNVPTGPDAPSGLAVTPSINGLYLTWKASPNDLSAVTSAQAGPGCVTKYEIARATTSGGVFSTIDTVEKGVLKYNDTTAEVGTTYYYKVRAMAGSEYSQYTAEVSGKK